MRTSRARRPRDRRDNNIEQPSLPWSPGRHSNRSTSTDEYATQTTMSMSSVVAAVESGKFDLADTTAMNSTPFCRVCLDDIHKTSRCQQIKDIASFIQIRNRNFSYRCNRQTGAGSKQPRQQQKYQRSRNHRGGWSNYDRNPSSNRNPTPLTSERENANMGYTNYAGHSKPPPNNRIYRNSSFATHSGLPPSNKSESNK